MSSRDYTKHLVSSTPPTNTKVGDEYYDPVTNKLYKRLATNGTTVNWIEIAPITNTSPILNNITSVSETTQTLRIANTSTTNTASIIYNGPLNSIDFYFN